MITGIVSLAFSTFLCWPILTNTKYEGKKEVPFIYKWGWGIWSVLLLGALSIFYFFGNENGFFACCFVAILVMLAKIIVSWSFR